MRWDLHHWGSGNKSRKCIEVCYCKPITSSVGRSYCLLLRFQVVYRSRRESLVPIGIQSVCFLDAKLKRSRTFVFCFFFFGCSVSSSASSSSSISITSTSSLASGSCSSSSSPTSFRRLFTPIAWLGPATARGCWLLEGRFKTIYVNLHDCSTAGRVRHRNLHFTLLHLDVHGWVCLFLCPCEHVCVVTVR